MKKDNCILNEEDVGITSKLKDLLVEIKRIITTIKVSISDFSKATGIIHVYYIIKTLMKETIPLNFRYDSSYNEKISRMASANEAGNALSGFWIVLNHASEKIIDAIRSSSEFIENQTSLKADGLFNYLDKTDSMAFAKYLYKDMKNADMPETFIGAYLMLIATISPFYYIMYKFKLSGEPDQNDPETLRHPFTVGTAQKSKTGLDAFEKKVIRMVKEIIEEYQNAPDEVHKNYVLSIAIIKKTLLFIFVSLIIWVTLPYKGSLEPLVIGAQVVLATYTIYITTASVIFATLATKYGEGLEIKD